MPVSFHTENISFQLKQKVKHKHWVRAWISSQNAQCGRVSFVFTSNDQIKSINQSYLNHNYFTDVITFDYSEGELISGDIFISIEEVKINARLYGTEMLDELRRVMIHGITHLLGYKDGTEKERAVMREKENEALHLWLKMLEDDHSV